MTMFAYYYIGIGLGVLLVSYFQVSTISFYVQLQFNAHIVCGQRINSVLYLHVDFLLGVSGCETDSENTKDIFQKGNANGDWMV